ncbi:MAG TPA: TerC family protein [Steroidobacteraceae bacterium]|nr:TerC family protein [Steroidobacteraceae bacterium]
MFELLSQPEVWISFLTLTFLEIVLGIDNIIFLSILVSRLPKEVQPKGRILGLAFAMVTRIGLLFSLTWLIGLTAPWFTVLGEEISGRDLILFAGGLFLLAKSVSEIHNALEGIEQTHGEVKLRTNVLSVAIQIGIIDIVFSLDSVLTAVGLADHLPVMVAAIVLAVIVMMFLARPIHEFIERHPTIKMLALSFLILIGVALIGESLEFHVPKGYLYFAMAFSVGVEMINIRLRKKTTPLDLRGPEFGSDDEPKDEPKEDAKDKPKEEPREAAQDEPKDDPKR